MNGFLERLVARAEQRAPMVERRQPGLFEPRPSGGAAIAAAKGGLELEDGEHEAARAEVSPRDRALNDSPPQVQHSNGAQPNSAGSRIATVQQASPPGEANPHRSTPSRGAARVAEPVTTPRRAPAIVGREPPPMPADTTRGRVPPSTAPLRARADAAAVESPRPRIRAKADESPQRIHRPIVAPPPRPVPAQQSPALPPVPRLVAPATAQPQASARAVRMAAAVKPPSVAAVPVLPAPVQVTIGRVEVRALSPAPPPRGGAPPAGPKLGLDEYLRQRHGAGK